MVESSIAILSPGYPDVRGGVTDHTARLRANWERMGIRVAVLGDIARVGAAANAVDAGASVLVQYVPFLYGRRGISGFPLRFTRLVRARGIPVTVFVHEPWVPPTRLPWVVLSPLQRRQLHKLLAAADHSATPVPAWVSLLGPGTRLIAAGSNMGEVDPAGELPAESLDTPVVFSPFAAGARWEWVLAATEMLGEETGLSIIGVTLAEARARGLKLPCGAEHWNWMGYLSPGEVLRTMLRAPLALAPFEDGLTTRRGSAMAALSAGVRLVSSTGPLCDEMFAGGSPVQLADTSDSFAVAAASVFATTDSLPARRERIAWYHERLGDEVLDRQLAELVLGSPLPETDPIG